MAKSKWAVSPIEIERRRKEKGMRLSGSVTEHRQADGKVFYTVRSESTPAKFYRIQWSQLHGRWACSCKDATYHLANPAYRSHVCAHQWAIELSLSRGLIHGVDSLVAARQRYQNGGAVRGGQNSAGVPMGRTTRGRRN